MVPQLLYGFIAKGHLPQVLRQSCLSANDKSYNDMISGDVNRYPGIYLTPNSPENLS